MDCTDALPCARVSFPQALRARVGSQDTVVVAGRTVREIIDALDHAFPGVRFNLCYHQSIQ
jgi:hypothetical protein